MADVEKNDNHVVFSLLMLVLGIFLGVLVGAHDMVPKDQIQTVQDSDRKANLFLATQLSQCTEKFKTATVLFEPGPEPSIPVLHGVFSVQANMPVRSAPKWIIPAKVQPYVTPNSPGFVYDYFDNDTRKIDGPYVPKTTDDAYRQAAEENENR